MIQASTNRRVELNHIVDGYVELVLDTVAQIEEGHHPPPEDIHARLLRFLHEATAVLGQRPDWLSAQYALVAWTDELLLGLPWSGRERWNNMVLEVERYATRVAGEAFFTRAAVASDHGELDVLRVYYITVLLGFRGVFAHHDVSLLRDLGLPPELSDWLEATRARLTVHQPRLEPLTVQRSIPGAQPVDLRRRIVWLSIAAMALVTLNITIYRLAQ